MTKRRGQIKDFEAERAKRVKLTPQESLKRMQAFAKRKEKFVAAVREGKNRSVSA